jgi:hypothetical protein
VLPETEFPRPLTPHERATLDFILSVDDSRLIPLRRQATTATAVAGCACPCASIDLAVDRLRGNRSQDLPDFEIVTNGRVVKTYESYFLYVFVRNGWLSSLGITYFSEPPGEFPPVEIWGPPKVSDRAAHEAPASRPTTGALSTLRRLLSRRERPSRS